MIWLSAGLALVNVVLVGILVWWIRDDRDAMFRQIESMDKRAADERRQLYGRIQEIPASVLAASFAQPSPPPDDEADLVPAFLDPDLRIDDLIGASP